MKKKFSIIIPFVFIFLLGQLFLYPDKSGNIHTQSFQRSGFEAKLHRVRLIAKSKKESKFIYLPYDPKGFDIIMRPGKEGKNNKAYKDHFGKFNSIRVALDNCGHMKSNTRYQTLGTCAPKIVTGPVSVFQQEKLSQEQFKAYLCLRGAFLNANDDITYPAHTKLSMNSKKSQWFTGYKNETGNKAGRVFDKCVSIEQVNKQYQSCLGAKVDENYRNLFKLEIIKKGRLKSQNLYACIDDARFDQVFQVSFGMPLWNVGRMDFVTDHHRKTLDGWFWEYSWHYADMNAALCSACLLEEKKLKNLFSNNELRNELRALVRMIYFTSYFQWKSGNRDYSFWKGMFPILHKADPRKLTTLLIRKALQLNGKKGTNKELEKVRKIIRGLTYKGYKGTSPIYKISDVFKANNDRCQVSCCDNKPNYNLAKLRRLLTGRVSKSQRRMKIPACQQKEYGSLSWDQRGAIFSVWNWFFDKAKYGKYRELEKYYDTILGLNFDDLPDPYIIEGKKGLLGPISIVVEDRNPPGNETSGKRSRCIAWNSNRTGGIGNRPLISNYANFQGPARDYVKCLQSELKIHTRPYVSPISFSESQNIIHRINQIYRQFKQ